jgi:hypothetical protein
MCNALNHSPDCDCGFGGDTGGGGWSYVRESWRYRDDDFCRPTSCPVCGAAVFFVRHNGGSVWFDELGPPWDKHACFDDEPSGRTLRTRLRTSATSAPAFGVILETNRPFGSDSGRVVVRCSDGVVLDRWFPRANLPVGQLVLVDLGSEITLVPVEESTSGESESKADRNGEPNRVGHSLSTGKSNAHDMLRQATCPLCRTADAEIGPSMIPGSGVRANRRAVRCPNCISFVIESSLAEGGSIPREVGEKLSRRARSEYREDGSAVLDVTETLVRSYSE